MTKTVLVLGSTILAVALAGCGRDGGRVSGAGPTPDPQEQGVKFAQCMRDHGIPMEDPKPGAGVALRVNKDNHAKVEAAQKACERFAPRMQADPQQQAEDLERMTKLAQCLRRNGIQAEDPKPGKPFTLKSQKGNEAKTEKAMKTCRAEAGMKDPPGGSSGSGGSLSKGQG